MIRKNWKKLFSLTIMLLLAVLAGTVALADTETTHSTYALLIEKQVVERLSDGSEKAIDSCETEYTFKIEGTLQVGSNGTREENQNVEITGAGKSWVLYNDPNKSTPDDQGLTVTELQDENHSLDIEGYEYIETKVTYSFYNNLNELINKSGPESSTTVDNVKVSTNGYTVASSCNSTSPA